MYVLRSRRCFSILSVGTASRECGLHNQNCVLLDFSGWEEKKVYGRDTCLGLIPQSISSTHSSDCTPLNLDTQPYQNLNKVKWYGWTDTRLAKIPLIWLKEYWILMNKEQHLQ